MSHGYLGTRRGGSRGLGTPADTSLTFPSCLSSPGQWLSPCRAEQGDASQHILAIEAGSLTSAGKGSASSRRAVGSSPRLRGGALAVPSFPLPQHVEPATPMPSAASPSFLSDPFSPRPPSALPHTCGAQLGECPRVSPGEPPALGPGATRVPFAARVPQRRSGYRWRGGKKPAFLASLAELGAPTHRGHTLQRPFGTGAHPRRAPEPRRGWQPC